MNVLIVYYSVYRKNTEKIAECMRDQFAGEMVHTKDFDENDIDKYDMIGFGSGVYNKKMHPSIFKSIEKSNLQNKNTFVFSTSAIGIKKYNNDAEKLLLARGANVVGSFSCRGFFTTKFLTIFGGTAKGHPNNDDFQNVKKFTESILHKVN